MPNEVSALESRVSFLKLENVKEAGYTEQNQSNESCIQKILGR